MSFSDLGSAFLDRRLPSTARTVFNGIQKLHAPITLAPQPFFVVRQCSVCKQNKPLNENYFSRRKSGKRAGEFLYVCRPCNSRQVSESHLRDPKTHQANQKRWRQANPAKAKAQWKRARKQRLKKHPNYWKDIYKKRRKAQRKYNQTYYAKHKTALMKKQAERRAKKRITPCDAAIATDH